MVTQINAEIDCGLECQQHRDPARNHLGAILSRHADIHKCQVDPASAIVVKREGRRTPTIVHHGKTARWLALEDCPTPALPTGEYELNRTIVLNCLLGLEACSPGIRREHRVDELRCST